MDDRPDPSVSPGDVVETAVVDGVRVGDEPASPWGFWATIGLSMAVLGVFVAVQTAVAVPFVFLEMQRQPAISPRTLATKLESNGLLLSLATLLSAPPCIGLVLLFAKLRKGISVGRYLGLNPVAKRAAFFWCLSLVLFMLFSDGLNDLEGREMVPEQMTRAYQTAGFLPLLWIALILFAPVFEEVFFRGFLFTGIRHSRLGGAGAIVISALTWAGVHMQYDVYQISVIFAGGLLLGMARLRTDSVYLTMAMHMLWNLLATVETAVVVGG
jgi:membrane protease YdiL (CAAX protease family)